MAKTTRRRFLASSAALAFPAIVPSQVLGANGAVAPSNQITIGQIGFGWIGGSHLSTLLGRKDVRYVGACDVNGEKLRDVCARIEKQYAENAGQASYKACTAYGDFRDMLARQDMDAVVIATPDHWHALLSIHAARAGKDIYCEKPLTLTLNEVRAVVKTVRRYDRVFQTGSQQRSNVFGKFRDACERVRNGRIGKVLSIDVSTGNPPVPCDLPAEPKPDHFDWDMWVGRTAWRPFHSQLADKQWRPYEEYCGGGFADMGAHHFDIAQWALGMDDSGPVEIMPPDGKERERVSFKYANGVIMNHVGGNCLGLTFHGTDGELYVGRDGFWSKPESIAATSLSPSELRLYRSDDHHGNWLDCIRTRSRCVADVEIGARTATICHLGNIAYQLKQTLQWDPVRERFTNNDQANRLMSRPLRSPWSL
ncbi:MAG: Gfo/Idh/MocA family oxidoreductase [Phycisphaerae bacterium]|nr:Gfo/Idh/MocA family oxidoreductase [Phycisphaerae bacterium]